MNQRNAESVSLLNRLRRVNDRVTWQRKLLIGAAILGVICSLILITVIVASKSNASKDNLSTSADDFSASTESLANTEVSKLLKESFDTLKFPEVRLPSLKQLQIALYKLKIFDLVNVPNQPAEIVKLLSEITNDDLTIPLLEKGLAMKMPELSDTTNFIPGFGYDLKKDSILRKHVLAKSPLDRKISPLGFVIPGHMDMSIASQKVTIFEFYSSYEDYFKKRFESTDFSASLTVEKFTGKVGFNDKKESSESSTSQIDRLSFVEERRVFKIQINEDKATIDAAFKARVKLLRRFDPVKCTETSKLWQDFFDDYGTSVVFSAYGGGAINILIQGEKLRSKLTSDDTTTISGEAGLAAIFGLEYKGVENVITHRTDSTTKLLKSTTLLGGDSKYQSFDFITGSDDKARLEALNNWQDSLPLHPQLLESKLSLVSIEKYMKKILSDAEFKNLNFEEVRYKWWINRLQNCDPEKVTRRIVLLTPVYSPQENALPVQTAVQRVPKPDESAAMTLARLDEGDEVFCNDNEICVIGNQMMNPVEQVRFGKTCEHTFVLFRYKDNPSRSAKVMNTFAHTSCKTAKYWEDDNYYCFCN